MSSLENIVNFLNTEYDNPQLVVSLLAKLSRKFYEPNSFTKIKLVFLKTKILLMLISSYLTIPHFLN